MYGLRRASSVHRVRVPTRCLARGRNAAGLVSGARAFSFSYSRWWTCGHRTLNQINRDWRSSSLQWKLLSSGSSNLPPHTLVTLPALSPTMETGTIVKWEKEVGDEVEEGDIIAQIETDKATMDMETPSAGYLATIIVPEGTSDIPMGKLLAIIVEDKSGIESFKNYQPSEVTGPPPVATPQTTTPTEAKTTTPTPSIDLPPHTLVTLPALSPTMETGSLAKWEKEVGDELEEGDIIAQIETDKATMDMETPSAGYLATIIIPEGSKDIPMGELLAVIVDSKESIPAFKDYVPPTTSAPPTTSVPPTTATPITPPSPQPVSPSSQPAPVSPPPATPTGPVGRVIASPFARTLARERGVDLSAVRGSGPGGRIVGRDVPQSAVGGAPSAAVTTPTPLSVFEDIPLTGMRKTIASRLQLSKQTIPHYYLSVDVNMEDVTRLRQQINSDDLKLSFNDFIIKAAALSMKSVPEVNSSFMDTFIRQYNNVDVSVAVSTPGGLITPIVFNADSKGLQAINEDVRQLAEKARSGKLKPQEFQGGTFTISNLGMFGIRNFSAVINPPQACILAVGTTDQRVIVDEGSDKGYRSAPIMSVTLSCDHRVVDGAVGAQWLSVFKSYLEKPFKMLI